MWLIIASVILIILLCVALYLSLRRIAQLVGLIDRLSDRVEKSLDVLDKSYGEITYAARSEILSDEPVIRQVVSAIRSAQNAVLLVANELVDFDESDSEE